MRVLAVLLLLVSETVFAAVGSLVYEPVEPEVPQESRLELEQIVGSNTEEQADPNRVQRSPAVVDDEDYRAARDTVRDQLVLEENK